MNGERKIGDVGYDLTGREVRILAIAENGFICEEAYSYQTAEDDGETRYGGLVIVSEVFDNPPHEKLNAEVSALHEEICTLQDRLDALRGEARDMKAMERQRLEKLKRNSALGRIEEFLDGKITYYVEINHGTVKIVDVKEEKSGNDRRERDLKLLTLFGKSNGDLAWRLNQYSDGSGSSNTEVIPCTSQEEALIEAKKQIELIYIERDGYYVVGAVDSAKKLGFAVPEEMQAVAKEYLTKECRRHLKDATETAERWQKELNALDGEAPAKEE